MSEELRGVGAEITHLASRLTEIQREAVARSAFLAGSWGLSDWNEDHPDIADDLPEDIACSVSGELTPLGLALHSHLTAPTHATCVGQDGRSV